MPTDPGKVTPAATDRSAPSLRRTASAGPRPPVWMVGGDLQTLVPALSKPGPAPPNPTSRIIEMAPESSVQVWINQPEPRPTSPRGTVLLIHGMEGSSESGYMRDTAREAVARGWVAVRMNLRTCGGTEALSRTLYNAGQYEDARTMLAVLAEEPATFPRPFVAAGFSLGGNLLLRYAGIEGAGVEADRMAAVNAPVDMESCLQALERPRNAIYHWHYTRALIRKLHRLRAIRNITTPCPSSWSLRSVRRFDDQITAPSAGYRDAADYYAQASSDQVLSAVRRRTLILSAGNDPFIPVEMYHGHQGNPMLQFDLPSHGGHCGFWQRGPQRSWVAARLMDFFEDGGRRPGAT